MEYNRLIEEVRSLDFIRYQDVADSAVKAVIGMLAGSMDEEHAKRLTEKLPRQLTYEKLKGRQAGPAVMTLDEYLSEIGSQFRLSDDQARRLVDTVFHLTKEAVGEETLGELEKDMPPDVAEEIEKA